MQPEPKHLSPWIAWSLVVLFFGIALFSTWYYYDQASTAYDNSVTFFGLNVSKNKTTSTTSTSTSISNSTIANWQKYTSPSYGYSIDFPKTWTWNGTDPKVVTLDTPENAALIKNVQPNTDASPHNIYIYYYPSIAEEFENVANKYGATTLAELMTKSNDLSQVADTTLGGVAAKGAVRAGMLSSYSIFAVNNNHLYEIVFGHAEDKTKLTATDTQILSTFQFTK